MIQLSMMFLAAVVIGGQGNRWGAIVGGVVVAYLPERFREFADFRIVVFGLLLLLLANFRPQGLLPPRRAKRAERADAATKELEGTRGGRSCLSSRRTTAGTAPAASRRPSRC